MMVEEGKNNQQQQAPTAATSFYGNFETSNDRYKDADFDLVSPSLLLKDNTADDDHLVDSQLFEDDDHLLDNLIGEDGGLISTMYNTERLDSIKILSDSVLKDANTSHNEAQQNLVASKENRLDEVTLSPRLPPVHRTVYNHGGVARTEGASEPATAYIVQSNEEEIVELILEEEMGEVIQFGRSGADQTHQQKQTKPTEGVLEIIQNDAMKSSSSLLVPTDVAGVAGSGNQLNEPPSIDLDWTTFEKICKLGEGANGTVFKVKSLKTSIFSTEHGKRIELSNPELLKKYGSTLKQKLGINMQSAVEKSNKTRQLLSEQAYVIKEIDVDGLPKQAAFEAIQEVEIMAEMDSHFVVGYYDSFITERSAICIIMEYCQHGDLHSAIKKQHGKSFANNFLWKVFIHICLGVHYLHARNVIHRDIKSLNVFLTQDNSAKLGDFGNIKKIKPRSDGQAGHPLKRINEEEEGIEEDEVQKVGTPYYLAPELWQNKHQTKASDIWAIGVILYEMCAQKYPYDAQNVEELEEKVCTQKYKPIPQGVTKDFNMIIKQCLQKKPENRASIDEIIFSEDFQNKAKINKITLPVHLNKQKLLQKIQTKKQLDADEKRLIIDLQKRGVLKNLDLGPLLLQSSSAAVGTKDEINIGFHKKHSVQHHLHTPANNNPESNEKKPPSMQIQTDNLQQMPSPAGLHMKQFPKSTRRKDSGGSSGQGYGVGSIGTAAHHVGNSQASGGSITPFAASGGHHVKHVSQMVGFGGSQRRLDIGGVRHSTQPDNAAASATKAPVINIQRPRLNMLNPLAHSTRDNKPSTTTNSTTTEHNNSTTNAGHKKTFAMPGATRTSKLRAAAQTAAKAKIEALAQQKHHHTDRGVVQPQLSQHQKNFSNASDIMVKNKRAAEICTTEPHEADVNHVEQYSHEKDDLGTFDLTEEDNSQSNHNHNENNYNLNTITQQPQHHPTSINDKDKNEENEKNEEDEDLLTTNLTPPSKDQSISGVQQGRRKTKSFRFTNNSTVTNSGRPKFGHANTVENATAPEQKVNSLIKVPTMTRNATQRASLQLQGPNSNLQAPSTLKQPMPQSQSDRQTTGLVDRRRMLKSPSAKELGAKSGLQTPSKIAQSQRTGIKVSTRIGGGSRLTARPSITNNKSPVSVSNNNNLPKRTKFTPSAAISGTSGKPPMITKSSVLLRGQNTGSRINLNDNDQLRKPTGKADQNRKITPGKKISSTTAQPSTNKSAKQSNLMARARSSEAVKDQAIAQRRVATESKNTTAFKQGGITTARSSNLVPAYKNTPSTTPQLKLKPQTLTSCKSSTNVRQNQPTLAIHRNLTTTKQLAQLVIKPLKTTPTTVKTHVASPLEFRNESDSSPRLMDLEEVGEEDDFEFPSLMPDQTPIHNIREIENRIKNFQTPQNIGGSMLYTDVPSSADMSQSQEQFTRHAVHRYAYDSFLQPASSQNLQGDPSLVIDDDDDVECQIETKYKPQQPGSGELKRPGFTQQRKLQNQNRQRQMNIAEAEEESKRQQDGDDSSSTGLQFDFNDRVNDDDDQPIEHPNQSSIRSKKLNLLGDNQKVTPTGAGVQEKVNSDGNTDELTLLDNAIQAESALASTFRQRKHSHFVDSKNEDMLLEDIELDDEKSVGEMLLMDAAADEEDLLI